MVWSYIQKLAPIDSQAQDSEGQTDISASHLQVLSVATVAVMLLGGGVAAGVIVVDDSGGENGDRNVDANVTLSEGDVTTNKTVSDFIHTESQGRESSEQTSNTRKNNPVFKHTGAVGLTHGESWSPYENPNGPPRIPNTTKKENILYCGQVEWEKRNGTQYRPDCDPPKNHLAVFYSDIEIPDEEDPEMPEGEEVNITHDFTELQSISELSQPRGSNPTDWAGTDDIAYITTHSIIGFEDDTMGKEWTLGTYRRFQLTESPVSYQYTYELPPAGQPELKSNGVIKDAYFQLTGVHGGAEALFNMNKDGEGPTPDLLVGSRGELYGFADYWLQPDNTPDKEIKEPVTFGSGCSAYQLQTQYTYHIEDHGSKLDPWMHGDEQAFMLGKIKAKAGGIIIPYSDYVNSNGTFSVPGKIWADIHEYEWQRMRTRVCDEQQVQFEGQTSIVADLQSGETGTVNVTFSDSKTKEFLYSGGQYHREATANHSWTVERTVTGPGPHLIESETTAEVTFTYWNWWNAEENQDTGGWSYVDDTLFRTDKQSVYDSVRAQITDNQDFDVEQTAIEIPQTADQMQYHVELKLSYDVDNVGATGQNISASEMDDLFIWSLINFDDDTSIQSPFKTYSYSAIENVRIRGDSDDPEKKFSFLVGSIVKYPHQLRTYMFSRFIGPQLTSGSSNTDLSSPTKLAGWEGSIVKGKPEAVHEHAEFKSESPTVHNKFLVKNVDKPAQEIVSVHERTFSITSGDTKIIEYREPVVDSIEYKEDEQVIEIVVLNEEGGPHRFRDVKASIGPTNLGTKETDANGRVVFSTASVPDVPSVHVEVPGDDPQETLLEGEQDYYYGSITAYKVFDNTDLLKYLYESVWGVLLAIPLVLLYLMWDNFEMLKEKKP